MWGVQSDFASLDKYSSWRVGRVVPMIRSAVRTTLCSLLWSDLVAELNQIVIDVQRNDGRVELYQQLLWQVELPQLANDLNNSTAVTVLFMMVKGGEQGGGPEVHDHLHCFECVKLQVVKTAPDSQLLNLLSVSKLITILNEADQCGVVCKLQELDRGVFRCAVSSGERTQPWGAPVMIVRVLGVYFPSLTTCCLSVRKLLIHWQMEVGTESWVSLGRRRIRMMVLKAELKSTNRILT